MTAILIGWGGLTILVLAGLAAVAADLVRPSETPPERRRRLVLRALSVGALVLAVAGVAATVVRFVGTG